MCRMLYVVCILHILSILDGFRIHKFMDNSLAYLSSLTDICYIIQIIYMLSFVIEIICCIYLLVVYVSFFKCV